MHIALLMTFDTLAIRVKTAIVISSPPRRRPIEVRAQRLEIQNLRKLPTQVISTATITAKRPKIASLDH